MARLYADENFPLAVVGELRRLGHDVATVYEAGKANQATPDSDILELACANGRAVLTLNRRDFIRLHESRSGHCGIVVCTFDVDFRGQALRIHAAVTAHRELSGLLIRVNRQAAG